MGNSAKIDLKADNSQLKKELNDSEDLVKQFASGVKTALVGIGAALALKEIAGVVSGWVSDASGAMDATAKLEAQIKATGGSAGYTAEQLAGVADELEKLTGIQAEAVQAGQSTLLMFENIQGIEFDRATKSAADLAAAMGTDVAGAAKLVGKALDDPITGLAALAKAGVEFSAAEQEMIESMVNAGDVVAAQNLILDKLDDKVGGVAEAMGQTFSGKLARLDARFGDLGETIAGFIIPYIEALLPAAEVAIGGMQMVLDLIGDLIGAGEGLDSLSQMFTDTFEWIVRTGVSTFNYLISFFETWQAQVEKVSYGVMLAFVTTFEDLKYRFTVEIPAYATWFANNFGNILNDVANFTSTVFTNMFKNVAGFFTSVWDYLQGGSTNFEWTSLTEGFEATMEELPKIAERKLTDTEKFLSQSINQMDKIITESFNARQAAGNTFVDKMFAKKDKEEEKILTNESGKRRDVSKKPETKPEVEPKAKPTKEEKAKPTKETFAKEDKPAETKPANTTAGTTVGLEELSKQISSSGVNQEPPVVNVEAPIVNVPAPVVTVIPPSAPVVPMPEVKVNIPDIDSPDVNVDIPPPEMPALNVEIPPPEKNDQFEVGLDAFNKQIDLAGQAVQDMAIASNVASNVKKEEVAMKPDKPMDLSPLVRDLIAAVMQTTEAVNNLNVGTV